MTAAADDEPPAPATDPADPPPASPIDPARLAEMRAAADSALNGMLAARRVVDELGAAEWGSADYDDAAAASAAADQAFLEERFEDARDRYDAARRGFEDVLAVKDDTLARLLAEGAAALAAPDAAAAATAFRRALLIEPGHAAAQIGRTRAGTLDELHRRLTAARTHESEGRLDFAYADYAAAAELDPHSEEARDGHLRLRTTLADRQFQTMMAQGLEALHRGDLDDARQRLEEAQRFRPEAVEVTQALAMVEEAELRAAMDRLRDDAVVHERAERWQDAWNAYRRILAMDPAIEFAQAGKERSEEMIRLEKLTNHYLANPALLIGRTTREDAKQLVERLATLAGLGPRLQDAANRLAEQVRLANTPLRVTLRSDTQTEVAVYRVAQLGTFDTHGLELLPGVYTVVGHRNGYRDVRLELRLEPGQTDASLTVVCTEPI
ncbi:MAG: hypothetical protein HKO59_13980 [Phycisphaerales bacterium]|nr:hypothetical protein [Phycisphaerales bacterium]